jgi:predicted metal-binding protein
MLEPSNELLAVQHLLTFALNSGATQAARIPPEEIQVENRLAANCREPKCPYFGMSASCPPYVGGPAAMRELLARCRHAIVLQVEVDSASLLGEERPQVFRLLHELAAAVENEGRRLGFSLAIGLAGGSCKASFCAEEETCEQITAGVCRHPTAARQSMSGFGINVGALIKSSGWSGKLYSPTEQGYDSLTWVAGLVLLGDQ